MKFLGRFILLTSIFSSFVSLSARAGMGALVTLPIQTYLETKCLASAQANLFFEGECAWGVSAFGNVLGIDDVIPVLFQKDFWHFLKSPETGTYLEAIAVMLEAPRSQGTCDLWRETLRLSDGNILTALEKIAVLFQQTGVDAAHVKYLRHPEWSARGRPENIRALRRVTLELGDKAFTQGCRLYPSFVDARMPARLSHFYVSTLLTHRLRLQNVPDGTSVFLPLMFSTTYELNELTNQRSTSEALSPLEQKTLWDAYASFTGSEWDAYGVQARLSYAEFAERYTQGQLRFNRLLDHGQL